MTIAYYVHAWQGLLMFLGGVLSILAAFFGYIQAGGGEELLRRALSNLETGTAQFDALDFRAWRNGEMLVTNLRHNDFEWPKHNPIATFKGLRAEEMRVQMDLLPWPPDVKAITVRGMHDTAIRVSEAFLQSGEFQTLKDRPIPPIFFEDCNLQLAIGNLKPLVLTGCRGVLRRDSEARDLLETPSPRKTNLRGKFSLSELNGKPFNFELESLDDGRWVLTGHEIQIDTLETLQTKTNPFAGKLDPVGLLLWALFSGEMGAKGTVASMHIVVQPATEHQKFMCDGEVAYRDLELRLPPAEKETGKALPFFLSQLLGADESKGENPWPRWMQVDQIKSGANGRVSFHMADGTLNFACDEGRGSAFTGVRDGRPFPPLEAFKGSVETDLEGRVRRIILRGFLGDELSVETRIERDVERKRTYEMILQPRAGDSRHVVFGKPLWRFVSRAKEVNKIVDGVTVALAEFELEGDVRHFPIKDWLPPGMQDLAGRIYAKGSFNPALQLLRLDRIGLDDSASVVYGGPELQPAEAPRPGLGPLWQAIQSFFGTDTAWKLQDLALQGEAEVEFAPTLRATLKNFSLLSGSVSHAGLTTDVALTSPLLTVRYQQNAAATSEIEVIAGVPDRWQLKLAGLWQSSDGKPATGKFTLLEKDIPLGLHPQRDVLGPPYVSDDKRRVNRTTIVQINDNGKVQRETKP